MKRFLNCDDSLSISSHSSGKRSVVTGTNSESSFNLSKKILLQFEEDMLHSDLKRDSFRARTATRNFVLNPLFEDKSSAENNQAQFSSDTLSREKSEKEISNKFDINLLEDSKKNCVENVFVDLINVRRTNSLKETDDNYKPNFIKKRCSSFRRLD